MGGYCGAIRLHLQPWMAHGFSTIREGLGHFPLDVAIRMTSPCQSITLIVSGMWFCAWGTTLIDAEEM